MKTAMSLQAVIFDMDGVLCSTVEYHYQSWKRAIRPYGMDISREANDKLRGLTRRKSLEVILKGTKFTTEQQERMLSEKHRHYLTFIQHMSPEQLEPGIARLLGELHAAGLKVGVASASRNVAPVLERLGIADKVQAVCDGNIASQSKPHPFPYQYTAEQLGVDPCACLAVEDSQAGLISARRAGMAVIGVGSSDLVGEADAVFPDLSGVDLADLIAVHASWLEKVRSG